MADQSSHRLPPEGADKPSARKTFTFRKTFRFGSPPPEGADVQVVPGPAQSFEWHLGDGDADTVKDGDGAVPLEEAQTYYEMLSGRRDPMRNFFVTARRTLNLVVTGMAIGIPVLLVGLGIITHADAQTIVVMGVAGLVVGLMLKSSFPKTPFD